MIDASNMSCNICSVYWDNGDDKPSYILLPNGITICSDDTRQNWAEELLAIIDCYNVFESNYSKNMCFEEKRHVVSAFAGIQSGTICFIVDDDTCGCWKIYDKGCSRLEIDEGYSRDNKFPIPRIQVALLVDASLRHVRLVDMFKHGINTLILNCTRLSAHEELTDIVLNIWKNKIVNQVLILAASGHAGKLLYDNFCSCIEKNCISEYCGNKNGHGTICQCGA